MQLLTQDPYKNTTNPEQLGKSPCGLRVVKPQATEKSIRWLGKRSKLLLNSFIGQQQRTPMQLLTQDPYNNTRNPEQLGKRYCGLRIVKPQATEKSIRWLGKRSKLLLNSFIGQQQRTPMQLLTQDPCNNTRNLITTQRHKEPLNNWARGIAY